MNTQIYFATTEAVRHESSNGGLLVALGIDGKLLVFQSLAFLILVFVLGKFVYPVIIKAIDSRREAIEAGFANAKKTEQALADVEQKIAAITKSARQDANAVIIQSQKEAMVILNAAEQKALARAEHIAAEAKAQLDNEVAAARQLLRDDTIKLIAMATERIINQKLDVQKDNQLIVDALAAKSEVKK